MSVSVVTFLLKLTMKKLPHDVQKIFSATVRIHSYKRAVEELVYNALDAKSSSIAIRLNLQDNSIQVIDNGCGIGKHDMKFVGIKYMTSKTVDIASLISTSGNYGYRGQSLASIVEVSEQVKITSRYEEETVKKTFYQGSEKEICLTDKRPSKGTTVEIKGFLFNLNIQKRNIEPLNELQDIKQFVEQLSLVHTNVSISVRDETNNEIIFQVHKSRDIFQTLHTLFNVEKENCMELKVEKKSYKVTAYIGKILSEVNENHWIYLNGRYLKQSKLHKVFDEKIMKVLCLKKTDCGNAKAILGKPNDDNRLCNKKIPFYYIFISCPYNDYDLQYAGSRTHLEFKKWDSVTNLLDKLAKFYIGDVKIVNKGEENVDIEDKDARDEIKKIVEKFLGSNTRKPGVSQMQNGIRGRLMKRNNTKKSKISLSKVIPVSNRNLNEVDNNQSNNTNLAPKVASVDLNKKNKKKCVKSGNEIRKVLAKVSKKVKENKSKSKETKENRATKVNKAIKRKANNELVKAFEFDNSQIKTKCRLASAKANELIRKNFNKNRPVFKNTVKYSTIKRNIQTISVRNFTKEEVRENVVFKKPKVQNVVARNLFKDKCKSTYDLVHTILQSQTDLNVYNSDVMCDINNSNENDNDCIQENKLTYQSHNYNVEDRYKVLEKAMETRKNKFITSKSKDDFVTGHVFRRPRPMQRSRPYSKFHEKRSFFNIKSDSSYTIELCDTKQDENVDSINNISEDSRIRNNILKCVLSQCIAGNTYSITSALHTELTKNLYEDDIRLNNENHGTYPINIHESNEQNFHDMEDYPQHLYENDIRVNNENEGTYTINIHESNEENFHDMENYTSVSYRHELRKESLPRQINVEFISNTQSSVSDENDDNLALEPLNICETLLTDSNHQDALFEAESNHGSIAANDPILDQVDESRAILRTDIIAEPVQVPSIEDLIEETSHHFLSNKTNDLIDDNDGIHNNSNEQTKRADMNISNNGSMETFNKSGQMYYLHKKTGMSFVGENRRSKQGDFNLKERPVFMPKGLSPLLENCQTKNVCDYDLDNEYFNESMYEEFARDVEINTEIYKADVQNVNEMTTKHIEKVTNKLKKDNASLSFDAACLLNAQVLGQVDCKFIAAKMKGITNTEHLVLFDQHAVHERIRLENNMAEYLTNNQWKSVALDEIIIKLKRDEMMCLHNYRNKFRQLGLKWTVIDDCGLKVNAIPQAIIGKNPRQVEVIMKAVKSLILEEIRELKLQKGSLNLYPKTIMELVFSEACRYAIKFGDKLSQEECSELLRDLSRCRAPYQCAHGRPSLAVLLDIDTCHVDYEINLNKLKNFKERCMN